MRVLVVEDDELIGDAVRAGLVQEQYEVSWVRDGLSAERLLLKEAFDLLVLDVGLPHRDGFALLGGLRRRGDDLPVLMLTARDTLADRVNGLDAGADDYVVKPFDLEELLARVRALSRRRHGRVAPLLRYQALAMNPQGHSVTLDGQPVELTPREFLLLELLLKHVGQVLSRGQLEEALYGMEADIDSNAIEVHVHHLRRKIGAGVIRTVRGVGYTIPRTGA